MTDQDDLLRIAKARAAELLQERNDLARQLADIRDQLVDAQAQTLEAWQTSVMWSQWAEDTANKQDGLVTEVRNSDGDSYEGMLSGAQEALEKVKDHWYDIGYATALKELHNHLDEVIGDWADKQGVGEKFRSR